MANLIKNITAFLLILSVGIVFDAEAKPQRESHQLHEIMLCQYFSAYASMFERTEEIHALVEDIAGYQELTPYDISFRVTLMHDLASRQLKRTREERNTSITLAGIYLYGLYNCNIL